MFETSAVPPKFKARFPVKVPSFSFRGGRFVSFLFKVVLLLSPLPVRERLPHRVRLA
jgi:hypothetical protein